MSSRPALEAVVFDLDGVIVDSETAWDTARREVVAEAGGHWREQATRDMMGMSAPEWAHYLHSELRVGLPDEEISDRVVGRLLDSYARQIPLLPGAVGAVRSLAGTWRLGLASSANRRVIDAVLARSALADCFSATVSAEEVPRGKPAPDVYLATAEQLRVPPSHAAAIEDSSNGLRAAAAAGMLVVAVPNRTFPPADDALALADLTLGSLTELSPEALAAAASDSRRTGAQ